MNFSKKIAVAFLALMTISTSAAAQDYENKRVSFVHGLSGDDCVVFHLADGVVNGQTQWMGIPRSHRSFSELFAILLTAKAGNLPVFVRTSGATVCGVMGLDFIALQ